MQTRCQNLQSPYTGNKLLPYQHMENYTYRGGHVTVYTNTDLFCGTLKTNSIFCATHPSMKKEREKERKQGEGTKRCLTQGHTGQMGPGSEVPQPQQSGKCN